MQSDFTDKGGKMAQTQTSAQEPRQEERSALKDWLFKQVKGRFEEGHRFLTKNELIKAGWERANMHFQDVMRCYNEMVTEKIDDLMRMSAYGIYTRGY